MSDTDYPSPDHLCLFQAASEQHGYFTAEQARGCGFRPDLVAFHRRSGRFVHIRHGLYRLRDYPSSPREEVVAAWLAVGKDVAVVSHESALDLLDLSDVVPSMVHLTVPRTKRNLPTLPGVAIHTTTRPLLPRDVVIREGVRLTSATRSILDAADAGTASEQIEMAITQAIDRGQALPRDLEQASEQRGRRVGNLVRGALPPVRS